MAPKRACRSRRRAARRPLPPVESQLPVGHTGNAWHIWRHREVAPDGRAALQVHLGCGSLVNPQVHIDLFARPFDEGSEEANREFGIAALGPRRHAKGSGCLHVIGGYPAAGLSSRRTAVGRPTSVGSAISQPDS